MQIDNLIPFYISASAVANQAWIFMICALWIHSADLESLHVFLLLVECLYLTKEWLALNLHEARNSYFNTYQMFTMGT